MDKLLLGSFASFFMFSNKKKLAYSTFLYSTKWFTATFIMYRGVFDRRHKKYESFLDSGSAEITNSE